MEKRGCIMEKRAALRRKGLHYGDKGAALQSKGAALWRKGAALCRKGAALRRKGAAMGSLCSLVNIFLKDCLWRPPSACFHSDTQYKAGSRTKTGVQITYLVKSFSTPALLNPYQAKPTLAETTYYSEKGCITEKGAALWRKGAITEKRGCIT